jgi:hypothetical protein
MSKLPAITTLILACSLAISSQSLPTDVARRYGGDFVQTAATGDLRFDKGDPNPPVLSVAVANQELRTERTTKDGTAELVLPLNGGSGTYKTVGGVTGTAKLTETPKYLEIATDVPSKQLQGTPYAHIQDVERWVLSGDGLTLKVCGHADSLGGLVQFRKVGMPNLQAKSA